MKNSNNTHQKEAALGSVVKPIASSLSRGLSSMIVGKSGMNTIKDRVLRGVVGNRVPQGLNAYKRNQITKMISKKIPLPKKSYSSISSTRIRRLGKTVDLATAREAGQRVGKAIKTNATKGAVYGGLGYGAYQTGKHIKNSKDPYNSKYDYNKHVKQNIVSGQIDPGSVHKNTIRSIMMKNSSCNLSCMEKKALVGSLVKKVLPSVGFTALSFPGATEEYKRKVLLSKNKSVVKPKMYGNVAQF